MTKRGIIVAGALAAMAAGMSALSAGQPEAPPKREPPAEQPESTPAEPKPESQPDAAGQPQDPKAGEPGPGDKVKGAENNALDNEMTPELERSVTQGLRWLASRQNQDGSFGDQRQWGPSVAITSLACLAFMSDGNLPDRGPYGRNVTRGLEYVLKNCAESGLISSDAGPAPMYGHGFATLFLGEIYGMTGGGGESAQAQRLHEALVRATRLIQGCQNEEGGWRYYPVPNDADTSVTICQIMGLRSARNAGLEISSKVIDDAVAYVRKCQNGDGGFRYQAHQPPSAWERSAASVASLQYAGVYDDRAISDGLKYVNRFGAPSRLGGSRHYFYGHYYAVQAMYLAGGDWWAQWWPQVRADLLAKQMPDGSWEENQVGAEYGTAMALIILQMPKRYLPIFQR